MVHDLEGITCNQERHSSKWFIDNIAGAYVEKPEEIEDPDVDAIPGKKESTTHETCDATKTEVGTMPSTM